MNMPGSKDNLTPIVNAFADVWRNEVLQFDRIEVDMNSETAELMNHHLSELVRHANEALFLANGSGDEVLKKKSQLVLASAISEIDLQLWEHIYTQHPVLRPADMVSINYPDA